MKLSAHIDPSTPLSLLQELKVDEVILGVDGLSAEGGAPLEEALSTASKHQEQPWSVSIAADRLVEQRHFDSVLQAAKACQNYTLRVRDIGLARHLNALGRSFHLNLESGHANRIGIEAWKEVFPMAQRFVFNHQMSRQNLLPLLQSWHGTETELLGLGSIVMYYSPRPLLSWAGAPKTSVLQSEEMGATRPLLQEHGAGVTLSYDKWLNLLPHAGELEEAGLTHLRIDLRRAPLDLAPLLRPALRGEVDLREHWPTPLLHGFYGANRSDSIFSKLVGRRPEEGKVLLAEVVDRRETRLLVRVHHPEGLAEDCPLCATDGKGREIRWSTRRLWDVGGEACERVPAESLALIERPKNLAVGTYLYHAPNSGP